MDLILDVVKSGCQFETFIVFVTFDLTMKNKIAPSKKEPIHSESLEYYGNQKRSSRITGAK